MAPLETQQVMNCNCSICCKNGYLNVYPQRADVVFRRGEELMRGYAFGEKRCVHKFCPTCGSSLFVDPHMDDREAVVVNVCVCVFLFFFLGWGGGGAVTAGECANLGTGEDV